MVTRKVLLVDKHEAQRVRDYLEFEHLFDKHAKIKIREDKARIPVADWNNVVMQKFFERFGYAPVIETDVILEENEIPQKNKLQMLKSRVESEIGTEVPDLPESFEIYGDLILIPSQALISEFEHSQSVLNTICDICRVKRIARKNAVVNDKFRSPRTDLLVGTDPWVCITENKIKYNFDITKSMFCRGNITEKLRIAQFDCTNEVVVDLFAGIGYFVLPYLVHANAEHVYACEWNPNSVKALELNLKVAGASDRCTVLPGDNRQVALQNVADRVNLGLIPSSEISWSTAVKALKPSGGVLHIHTNIETTADKTKSKSFEDAGDSMKESIQQLLQTNKQGDWSCQVEHIECVKSYAPRIYHLVYDVRCSRLDL